MCVCCSACFCQIFDLCTLRFREREMKIQQLEFAIPRPLHPSLQQQTLDAATRSNSFIVIC